MFKQEQNISQIILNKIPNLSSFPFFKFTKPKYVDEFHMFDHFRKCLGNFGKSCFNYVFYCFWCLIFCVCVCVFLRQKLQKWNKITKTKTLNNDNFDSFDICWSMFYICSGKTTILSEISETYQKHIKLIKIVKIIILCFCFFFKNAKTKRNVEKWGGNEKFENVETTPKCSETVRTKSKILKQISKTHIKLINIIKILKTILCCIEIRIWKFERSDSFGNCWYVLIIVDVFDILGYCLTMIDIVW